MLAVSESDESVASGNVINVPTTSNQSISKYGSVTSGECESPRTSLWEYRQYGYGLEVEEHRFIKVSGTY